MGSRQNGNRHSLRATPHCAGQAPGGVARTVRKQFGVEYSGPFVETITKALSLQPREFRLLAFLMQHAHQIVTRTMLLESVWDYRFDPQTNVIDVHISRLRSKVDKGFATPLIHTVRGVGYSLSDQPQDLPEVV